MKTQLGRIMGIRRKRRPTPAEVVASYDLVAIAYRDAIAASAAAEQCAIEAGTMPETGVEENGECRLDIEKERWNRRE